MDINFDQITQLVDLLSSKGLVFFVLWIVWKAIVPSVITICSYKFVRWLLDRCITLYEKSKIIEENLLKKVEDNFYNKLGELCKKKK